VRSVWRRTGVTIVFVTHDIDEAVDLGQRVLALSASPTVVQEDLAVDLPDDRDHSPPAPTPPPAPPPSPEGAAATPGG
jgi:NitT/TauT family transport system ATP-binding protein